MGYSFYWLSPKFNFNSNFMEIRSTQCNFQRIIKFSTDNSMKNRFIYDENYQIIREKKTFENDKLLLLRLLVLKHESRKTWKKLSILFLLHIPPIFVWKVVRMIDKNDCHGCYYSKYTTEFQPKDDRWFTEMRALCLCICILTIRYCYCDRIIVVLPFLHLSHGSEQHIQYQRNLLRVSCLCVRVCVQCTYRLVRDITAMVLRFVHSHAGTSNTCWSGFYVCNGMKQRAHIVNYTYIDAQQSVYVNNKDSVWVFWN